MNLGGKVALVTGSSSGIGLGIAEALAQAGASIRLHGVEPVAQLRERAQDMQHRFGVVVSPLSLDLSDAELVSGFCHREAPSLSEIDILVNNAGVQHLSPLETFPFEKWQLLLQLHLTTPFLLMQALLPSLRRKMWGRIVNISSVHGLVASVHKAAYVSAKHGILGLTKVAALETAGTGVTVNSICPGWVRTPLVEAQIATKAKASQISQESAAHELLAEKQPSLQFTEPADIGAMVVFLCSPAGQNLTGQALTMDGGWTAQ